jgi:hypothetical protein
MPSSSCQDDGHDALNRTVSIASPRPLLTSLWRPVTDNTGRFLVCVPENRHGRVGLHVTRRDDYTVCYRGDAMLFIPSAQ